MMKKRITAVPLLTLGLLGQLAVADESPKHDGFTIDGSVYAGTVYRTTAPDPGLIPAANGAAVGITTNAPGGANQDDGDLNFGKWRPVSTTVKGLLTVGYNYGAYGIVGQAQGWYDYALRDVDRSWGNSPNNYAANTPLSDKGFSARDKFANVVLDDLYLHGQNELGVLPLDWKLGQQRLDWGNNFQFRGGLNDLSPEDLPARRRAGALPEEGRISVPAAYAKLGVTQSTAVSGFLQFHFEPNTPMGCGTFYSQLDFIAEGCDKVFVGKATASDRTALANGAYITRAPTETSSKLEGGLGITQQLTSIGSELGLYLTQFHARKAYYGAFNTTRSTTTPFVPKNPDGENPTYFTQYPDDVRMAALTFSKKLEHGTIIAEASYRPNQPFQYNAIDELQAFVNPGAMNSPLYAPKVQNLPLGAHFNGFERHKTAQFDFGGTQGLPGILGANGGQVGAELSYKWADLPDVSKVRFGRPDVFGQAPFPGSNPCTGSAATCSTDGYTSRSAFGYRVHAGLHYADLLRAMDITPAVVYGQDVVGWSEDGSISKGRHFVVASLKAEIRKAYQLEMSWQPIWGGVYDNLRDRDSLSLSLGYKF